MIEEIKENIKKQGVSLPNTSWHLAVCSEPCLSRMLHGEKTIESRFSKHKILPYQAIDKGAIVFVKKSSGPVVAYFTIKEVLFFDLKETNISSIREKYAVSLCVDEDFWEEKSTSNYATLIIIDKLVALEPFKIPKKGMQSWIQLS